MFSEQTKKSPDGIGLSGTDLPLCGRSAFECSRSKEAQCRRTLNVYMYGHGIFFQKRYADCEFFERGPRFGCVNGYGDTETGSGVDQE